MLLKKGRFTIPLTLRYIIICRTGIVQPRQLEAVTVEQDINTLVEDLDTKVFSVDDFRQFVNEAATEIGKILELYFPEGA